MNNLAEKSKTPIVVYDDVSMSYCICAAYYYICSKDNKYSSNEEITEEYKKLSNNAINIAFKISKLSKNNDNAKELTIKRFKKVLNKMIKIIKNNNNDMSILTAYYDKHCKILIENSDEILNKCADRVLGSNS